MGSLMNLVQIQVLAQILHHYIALVAYVNAIPLCIGTTLNAVF